MFEVDNCIYPETIKIGAVMDNKTDLSGNLEFLTLADLIQLLGSNGVTGILRVIGHYSQHSGMIFFEKGNPINARNGSLTGIDALNSLFGWTKGEFEFSRTPVSVEAMIKKSRMQIILDGIRMLDEGIIEKAGPVHFEKTTASESQQAGVGPIVKGPMVEYIYVVDEEEFEDGEEIVVEGKHGSWIWVILEGVVQISKETSQGRAKILRLSNGSFIGSIASFLLGGNIRSATAIALGKVQLGVLDSQRLFVEFSRLSPELREMLLSLDRRLKQVTIKSASHYFRREKNNLTFSRKNELIRQGDSEERLFRISKGHADIVRKSESGEFVIGTLEQGDFIGNFPFINMGLEPEAASIFVSEDIELNPLDLQGLQEEFGQLSNMFKNIIENLATNISVTSLVPESYKHRTENP
jgi:CRP-like cAMP-binding protein